MPRAEPFLPACARPLPFPPRLHILAPLDHFRSRTAPQSYSDRSPHRNRRSCHLKSPLFPQTLLQFACTPRARRGTGAKRCQKVPKSATRSTAAMPRRRIICGKKGNPNQKSITTTRQKRPSRLLLKSCFSIRRNGHPQKNGHFRTKADKNGHFRTWHPPRAPKAGAKVAKNGQGR